MGIEFAKEEEGGGLMGCFTSSCRFTVFCAPRGERKGMLSCLGRRLIIVSLLTLFGSGYVKSAVQSEVSRLAEIRRSGAESDGPYTLFQPVKLNQRDVDMLRRDRRRTVAAYPDVPEDQLFEQRWFAFDEAARVSSDGHWNSHGSQDPKTGKFYLESALESIVRAEYPKRADDATTTAFFKERKEKQQQGRRARLEKDGPMCSWGGTGGFMTVRLNNQRQVVVQRAQEWAAVAKEWTFPFIVEEWLEVNVSDLGAIQKIPSFRLAVEREVSVEPSGVRVTMGQ